MVTVPPFAKRRNNITESIDSICTKCFKTIATESSEVELVAHETRHLCDPYWEFVSLWFDPESRAQRAMYPPARIPAR